MRLEISGPTEEVIKKSADRFIHGVCRACDRMKHTDNLCPRCQHLRIRHLLICVPNSEKFTRRTELVIDQGLSQEVQGRKDCAFCRFIIHSLEMGMLDSTTEERLRLQQELDSGDVRIQLRVDCGKELRTDCEDENIAAPRDLGWSSILSVHYVQGSRDGDGLRPTGRAYFKKEDDFTPGKSNFDRATAGSVISWTRVQDWLKEDDEKLRHHTPERNDMPRRRLPEGFMIVDVEARCVTKAPKDCRYAALSYVWGPQRPDQLELTTANAHHLLVRGSLNDGSVPGTIRDAMTVCAKLGIGYLWVDRLCILQDGTSHKTAQISAMGAVYSSAYITLCAVAGTDADSGLLGLESRPRSGGVHIADLVLMPEYSCTSSRRSELWWKRGWTYQEYLLSNRTLLFTETHLDLNSGTNHECEGPTTSMPFCGPSETQNAPGFELYKDTVRDYNKRELSRPTDIYNAFFGIFEKVYGTLDQFFFGLPRKDFDGALLWYTEPSGQTLIPRISDDGTEIPSWTWARSQGITSFAVLHHCSTLAHWRSCITDLPLYYVLGMSVWENSGGYSNGDYPFCDDSLPRSVYASAASALIRSTPQESKKFTFPQPLSSMSRWSEDAANFLEDLGEAHREQLTPSPPANREAEDSPHISGSGMIKAWTTFASLRLVSADDKDEPLSSFYLGDGEGHLVGHSWLDLDVVQNDDATSCECIALSVGKLQDWNVHRMFLKDETLGFRDAATSLPPIDEWVPT